MKTLLHILAVGALCVGPIQASQAQAPGTAKWADSLVRLIEQADRDPSGNGYAAAVALADRVLTVTPNDGVMLHYKGYALYRQAARMTGARAKEDDIKAVLEEAEDALEKANALLKWPEGPALHSSVVGQLIGIGGMMAGMRLGPKAERLMDDAVAMGPANPRVWMLRGVAAIYKPKMFGGGTDVAEQDLKKALELFAKDNPAPPAPRWGHSEAYAWLGQVQAMEKRIPEARASYNKALEIDPNNTWVKYQLLPALDKP